MPCDPTTAIETVFRIEFARLVAGLTRYVGDVGLAEDLAQDALVEALSQWRDQGVPRNPGAWLMTVGKRRAVDRFRRDRTLGAKYAQLGRDLGTSGELGTVDFDRAFDDHIEDDLLRLIFTACHPVVSVTGRTALTLRLVGGLTTSEIARSYLQPEPTIAARITRAKKAISQAGVPFEVPVGVDRTARLASVLQVIYLIFNEGYSATAGDNWLRPALCVEAVRLARVLAGLARQDAEVHGLLALLEIQSSRTAARVDAVGTPVLLLDQDRRRWDRLLINRGLAALDRAQLLAPEPGPGPYTLQAAIAACHARAFRAEETDWARVASLYAQLARTAPSPIVELNRAVAVSMTAGPAGGPAVALELIDQLVETNLLDGYHLMHSVRGDLLDRLGRPAEAALEFDRAAALTHNAAEQSLCAERAAASRLRAER